MKSLVGCLVLVVALSACALPACAPSPGAASQSSATAAKDPLPSWNAGATRTAIVDFVRAVTTTGSPDFVPPPERIAVFDSDGTLWAEQLMYFQVLFALDRIRALAPDHPEWKTKDPYRFVLAGDMKALAASGEKAIVELLATAHTGMTTDEFAGAVRSWIETVQR